MGTKKKNTVKTQKIATEMIVTIFYEPPAKHYASNLTRPSNVTPATCVDRNLNVFCLNLPHTSRQVKIFRRPTKNRLVCGGLNESYKSCIFYIIGGRKGKLNTIDNTENAINLLQRKKHPFDMEIMR